MFGSADAFFIKSKSISKYFLEREKTENEIVKEKELCDKVLEFYKRVYDENAESLNITMFDYNLFNFGYMNDYGYYVIKYSDWSQLLVHSYKDNLDEVFYALASSILDKKRNEFETKHKRNIKKDIKTRFGRRIDFDRIFIAEYNLDKWNRYYNGNIPTELVSKYEEFINLDPSIYNSNSTFNYKNNKLTKTLKKTL